MPLKVLHINFYEHACSSKTRAKRKLLANAASSRCHVMSNENSQMKSGPTRAKTSQNPKPTNSRAAQNEMKMAEVKQNYKPIREISINQLFWFVLKPNKLIWVELRLEQSSGSSHCFRSEARCDFFTTSRVTTETGLPGDFLGTSWRVPGSMYHSYYLPRGFCPSPLLFLFSDS